MERLNVIEKIDEPTERVNSMAVVVKPNGKLRICIDPRDLNQDEGSEMPLSPQPKAHDEKLCREDLYDSSRNQSFQAEESENIANQTNENDVSNGETWRT